MELYLERFDVAALVRDVAAVVQPLAGKNGNRLDVDCPDAIGTMHADLTKVRQTLFNLLSNASKFTEGGTVSLAVARERVGRRSDWIVFRVTDTGIGMTPEQLAQALPGLHPGRRLHHAQVRRHRARAGDQPAVLPDDGRRHHRRERAGPGHHLHHPAAGPASPRPSKAGAPRPTRRRRRSALRASGTVLVIDDDPAARDLMQRFLAREGFRVVTAAGGEEGLRLARELRPAAITLDVMMPGMDGWAVLTALKADPDARRHPGHHADHRGRQEPGLRARRRRLPHQADRPRPPGRRC